jgi:hypothetical protein
MAGEAGQHRENQEYVLELGHWRRIGRNAFHLVMILDEDGLNVEDLPLSFAADTLRALSGLDGDIAIAQHQLGAEDLRSDLTTVSKELDRLYGYAPLAKPEFRRLGHDDRKALTSKEEGWLDELNPQLRGYVERTNQWLTVGAGQPDHVDRTGQAPKVEITDEPWANLPEGPLQVRRAATALFHLLADDRWTTAGPDYEPPDYVSDSPPY